MYAMFHVWFAEKIKSSQTVEVLIISITALSIFICHAENLKEKINNN